MLLCRRLRALHRHWLSGSSACTSHRLKSRANLAVAPEPACEAGSTPRALSLERAAAVRPFAFHGLRDRQAVLEVDRAPVGAHAYLGELAISRARSSAARRAWPLPTTCSQRPITVRSSRQSDPTNISRRLLQLLKRTEARFVQVGDGTGAWRVGRANARHGGHGRLHAVEEAAGNGAQHRAA